MPQEDDADEVQTPEDRYVRKHGGLRLKSSEAGMWM
jgi:hypothetical protein